MFPDVSQGQERAFLLALFFRWSGDYVKVTNGVPLEEVSSSEAV